MKPLPVWWGLWIRKEKQRCILKKALRLAACANRSVTLSPPLWLIFMPKTEAEVLKSRFLAVGTDNICAGKSLNGSKSEDMEFTVIAQYNLQSTAIFKIICNLYM